MAAVCMSWTKLHPQLTLARRRQSGSSNGSSGRALGREPLLRPIHARLRDADGPPDAHDPAAGRVDASSGASADGDAAAAAAGPAVAGREQLNQADDEQQPAKATSSSSSSGTSDDDEEAAAAAEEGDDEPLEPADIQELYEMLQRRLALDETGVRREPVLPSLDLAGVAAAISLGRVRRIIAMCGAGISVSAGIPDFRTPGTGLYSQLERFGLPEPEAVFSISFFRKNPKPFHLLAKELFPGNYKPTPTHFFIKLLHDKGLLLRCFTQNIDSLEHEAGLPQSAVVAAHGNFDSAHCIKCGKEHSLEHVKTAVFDDDICYCSSCKGLVKPDIVFFGEQLPDRFYERMEADFPACDLLLVMGTSLVVHPFASLIDAVPDLCPRVLINRERVGEGMGGSSLMRLMGLGGGGGGFTFEDSDSSEGAYRDVLVLGDTDDGVRQLAELLGWSGELDELIATAKTPTKRSSSSSQQDSSL